MTGAEPGFYHAEGDPPGTVRYWDGTVWTTEPSPRVPAAPAGEEGGLQRGSPANEVWNARLRIG